MDFLQRSSLAIQFGIQLLDFAMESLQLRSAFMLPPSLPQEFPISSHSLSIPKQAFFRSSKCWCKKFRIGTVSVRARRGNGGEEEAAAASASPLGAPKEEAETQRRRPLWQRALGVGARKLGLGETWKEDPRGRQELEDLDSFLEGRVEFRWKEVLEPSVENGLALVLTGLLLYAVVLIGWQLVLVAAAITFSALKYAVIAAILLGVLIFFL